MPSQELRGLIEDAECRSLASWDRCKAQATQKKIVDLQKQQEQQSRAVADAVRKQRLASQGAAAPKPGLSPIKISLDNRSGDHPGMSIRGVGRADREHNRSASQQLCSILLTLEHCSISSSLRTVTWRSLTQAPAAYASERAYFGRSVGAVIRVVARSPGTTTKSPAVLSGPPLV